MKFKLSLFLLFTPFLLLAQDENEGCKSFFTFTEGTLFEHTYYDKKERMQSRVSNEVFLVEEDEEKDGVVVARVESKFFDEDDEQIMEAQYDVICDNGAYRTDLSNLISPSFREMNINAEMEISGSELKLPAELEVGQELPEAETSMEVSSGGMKIMTTTIRVYNRKVEAREELTTTAGTFDCYKITYDMDVKTIIKQKVSAAEWWAPGVGIVRSESYKKNGKLTGYSELTKFEE